MSHWLTERNSAHREHARPRLAPARTLRIRIGGGHDAVPRRRIEVHRRQVGAEEPRVLVIGVVRAEGRVGELRRDELRRRQIIPTERRVRAAGWELGNVDATIVAQAPKLAPYIDAMRARLAAALGVGPERVSVKAKTAERMGPVGEGRAIEARAVCLLVGRAV